MSANVFTLKIRIHCAPYIYSNVKLVVLLTETVTWINVVQQIQRLPPKQIKKILLFHLLHRSPE